VRCELTHLVREPIDVGRASAQHAAYESALERLGCMVERLPELPDQPDSVFVEDAAVVFDELAVIARPGAESRRAEVPSVERAVAAHRPLAHIEAPGTLDGGDVLIAGRRVFIGVTRRTNAKAVSQMQARLAPHGYTVTAVPLSACLHLKSASALAAPDTVLFNPAWVDRVIFRDLDLVEIDPAEPMGANVLRVGEVTLCAAAFPRTRERLEARGIVTEPVEASEIAKAEGALTCCSVIVPLDK
jgi:dimethylargininase